MFFSRPYIVFEVSEICVYLCNLRSVFILNSPNRKSAYICFLAKFANPCLNAEQAIRILCDDNRQSIHFLLRLSALFPLNCGRLGIM